MRAGGQHCIRSVEVNLVTFVIRDKTVSRELDYYCYYNMMPIIELITIMLIDGNSSDKGNDVSDGGDYFDDDLNNEHIFHSFHSAINKR